MLINRRFTPPTCTLEIEVTRSALPFWQKRKPFKDVQFQLSFDDPRLAEAEQVTIEGDRTQLEQLYQAVTNYIQNFLQQSSLEQLLPPTSSYPSKIEPTKPYLQTQGLIAHELFLGSLKNSNSGDKINLSTTQLFDLVTALEDYQLEVATTANPNSTQGKKFPFWAILAASLLVVAGLTALGFNLYNRSSKLQTASNVPESSLNEPPIEPDKKEDVITPQDVIPPQITKSPEKPETPKQLENPLSSNEKLPPPPPVDLPKAPPVTVPDFSKYPLPKPNQIPKIEPRIAREPQPPVPQSSSSKSEIAINPPQEDLDIPDVPPLSSPLLPTESDIVEDSLAKADNNAEQEQSFSLVESDKSGGNLQLKEVKQYFQQQWQPPEQLKQTIEYRLVISSDGSIIRITPIGKASEIFVDRTNIPLMGESFITPSATKGNQTIRLLLSPDGQVKTFLESK